MKRIYLAKSPIFWVLVSLAPIILYMLAPTHISLGSDLTIQLEANSMQWMILFFSLSTTLKAIQSYINGKLLKYLPTPARKFWLGRILGIRILEIKPIASKNASTSKQLTRPLLSYKWQIPDKRYNYYGHMLITDDKQFPDMVVYRFCTETHAYFMTNMNTLLTLQPGALFTGVFKDTEINIFELIKIIKQLDESKETCNLA